MSGRRGSYRDDEIPTLYVRQVHYSARPDDLRALFERIGPVRDVYIPLDYYTRESRGFAYVKFEFTRDAEDALRELNGASILGRRIEIEWAEGQRKTKTEMRARDSYNSYRARNRYRSRSPYKSRHEHSPRRRSCSRRNSHSRSKRRSHHSRRRHYSKSRRHHSNARSRNSRSTRSSSASVRKKRNSQKIKRSKSPLASGSLLYSLNEIKDSSDEKQNIIVNEYNILNRQNAEKLKEPVDELEIRSETRISDVEINEKEIQEAVQTNGSIDYIDDHVGVEVNGSNASATEAGEEDKVIMDIEVIDEIVEQSGIFFNDTVVEGVCLDDNINVQELLITDTTN
ncbi:RNA recognition motif family protein [Acanthocheilonema viteae]